MVTADGPLETAENLYSKVGKAKKARQKLTPMLDLAAEEEKDVGEAIDIVQVLALATPSGDATEFCTQLSAELNQIEKRLKIWYVHVNLWQE